MQPMARISKTKIGIIFFIDYITPKSRIISALFKVAILEKQLQKIRGSDSFGGWFKSPTRTVKVG